MSSTPSPDTTRSFSVPPELQPLAALALLLEKLERTPRQASPAQFQAVSQRLAQLLAQAAPGPQLDQLIKAFPATAELWENLHSAQAGLCRSPLEAGLNAEQDARALINMAMARRH